MSKKSLAAALKNSKTKLPPHVVVQALAGTGKTTTLIEGLKGLRGTKSKLKPSPQQKAVWDAIAESKGARNIAFVAFNKSIASELQERVPPGVDAMTMHSFGNRAVRSAFGNLYVTEYRVSDLLSHHTGLDLKDLRKNEFKTIKAVEEMVRLCKMNLVGREHGYQFIDNREDPYCQEELERIASHYEVELDGIRDRVFELVPAILELSKDVQRDRKMDYSDMIWLPVVLDLPLTKYDLLLVDESQDLNRCQQALARRAGSRLVFCGDRHQAIYGFAGADSESMDRLVEELAETEQGVVVLPLTMTRRCGKAIVEEAKKIVPDFEAHESNPEGIISRAKYKGPAANVFPIVIDGQPRTEKDDPTKTSYHSRVEDGDMLLCRVNAPLVSQCFQFLRMGRKAEIQGRDIGGGLIRMIKKFSVTTVPDLIEKLSTWLDQEQQKEQRAKFPNENKLIALQDKFDCISMFCEDMGTVDQVIQRIESVFTDNRESPGIKLSSIHKSKGLEAKRIFLLEPKGATVPHPMAKSEWQRKQEWNLRYVGITRAIEELVFVTE